MIKKILIGLGVAGLVFTSLLLYGWFGTDYKSARDLLYDLDNGYKDEEVVGKTAMLDVKNYQYTGLVYYFKPHERIEMVSPNNPKFKNGRSEIVEITHVQKVFDHYIIGYKLEGDDDYVTNSTE